jgi:hypothetical protein
VPGFLEVSGDGLEVSHCVKCPHRRDTSTHTHTHTHTQEKTKVLSSQDSSTKGRVTSGWTGKWSQQLTLKLWGPQLG